MGISYTHNQHTQNEGMEKSIDSDKSKTTKSFLLIHGQIILMSFL